VEGKKNPAISDLETKGKYPAFPFSKYTFKHLLKQLSHGCVSLTREPTQEQRTCPLGKLCSNRNQKPFKMCTCSGNFSEDSS